MKAIFSKFLTEARTYGKVYLNTTLAVLICLGVYLVATWVFQFKVEISKKIESPVPITNIQAQAK